jgi:hypothetical protein
LSSIPPVSVTIPALKLGAVVAAGATVAAGAAVSAGAAGAVVFAGAGAWVAVAGAPQAVKSMEADNTTAINM